MTNIDLAPLYRNSVGFDRFASLVDNALRTDSAASGYPPYNIEVLGENQYSVTLAVAGFEQDELDIHVENSVLRIKGEKGKGENRQYLHQGIANRSFERKFNLADHVEVKGANLKNGLLTVSLVREVPEAMKPRNIKIDTGASTIEHSDNAVNEDTGKAA